MGMYGHMGRLLYVNLTDGEVTAEPLPPEVARAYIGGTGLAAYLIFGCGFGGVDPLGPDNLLVFATGPLTGTRVPTSGRFAVAGKSPLTGIWGESDSGGWFGVRLKAAGYDALVVRGRASCPVYLVVSETGCTICPAADLWGKDTYETHAELRVAFGERAAVVCIGPAGERQIPMAGIMSEGIHGRAAGRCGLGAAMGAKNLKAIVAQGSVEVSVAAPGRLQESIRRVVPAIVARTQQLRRYGTAGGVITNAMLGDMSARNWTVGNWVPGAERIGGDVLAREFLTARYYCPSCVVGCGRVVRIPRGPHAGEEIGGPEYETIAGFGAQCLVDDLAVIIEANDLCNRWGLDTISASGAIAFLMEAVERGLVRPPAGCPPIVWGNGEAVLYLLHGIMDGKGPGQLLRNGVRAAAARLGEGARGFAMHVKGLELPYHDPRALSSMAVAYATHPRGACHRGCSHNLERFPIPELGYDRALDRLVSEGKGVAAAVMQNYAELYNCLKLCQFVMASVRPSDVLEWLNLVTGWDMDMGEFLRVGERSLNLKRLLELSCGMTGRDDRALPPRLLREPFESGESAGHVPDLDTMLTEYYRARGWDQAGVPDPAKREELFSRQGAREDLGERRRMHRIG